MFNIGFGELAIICIVLIIAVGPERLPSMMKTLGKTMRTLRQASRDIRASTGIDELLREDLDLYAPPVRPRRPAVATSPEAPAAPAAPVHEELGVARTDPAPPKPLSREEAIVPEVVGGEVGAASGALPLPTGSPSPSPSPSTTTSTSVSGAETTSGPTGTGNEAAKPRED
jgi:sec-independent protein translocase protein TatB